MKNEKIPHCRNNSKINTKVVERGKIDTSNIQIQRPLTLLTLEIFGFPNLLTLNVPDDGCYSRNQSFDFERT